MKPLIVRDFRLLDDLRARIKHLLSPGEDVFHLVCQMRAGLSVNVVFNTDVQLKGSGVQPDACAFEDAWAMDFLHAKETDVEGASPLQLRGRNIHLCMINPED